MISADQPARDASAEAEVMFAPAILMWCIVALVGVPAAWRNPTAAALVLAKIAGWFHYKLTNDNLPISFYLFPDIFVIAVIFARPARQQARNRVMGIVLDRSPADRAVLLIFAAMWCVYVAPLDPYYAWWALYYGVIAQFLFAGVESLVTFRRAVIEPPERTDSSTLLFARGGGGG